jgi:hypothetical protein
LTQGGEVDQTGKLSPAKGLIDRIAKATDMDKADWVSVEVERAVWSIWRTSNEPDCSDAGPSRRRSAAFGDNYDSANVGGGHWIVCYLDRFSSSNILLPVNSGEAISKLVEPTHDEAQKIALGRTIATERKETESVHRRPVGRPKRE